MIATVAIIPARGRSKRIPRKNVKPFNGKPIIAYSINLALASGLFDRVVVSTDDDEIADVAREFGAETPFKRPAALSGDFTPTHDVVAHALGVLAADTTAPVAACCLYATAPFARVSDIKVGMEMALQDACAYAFPITTFQFPIQRALIKDDAGYVKPFDLSATKQRSQDLVQAWHDAGQFYCASVDTWLANPNIYAKQSRGIAIPRYLTQDIDTPEDWVQAELMHSVLQTKENL